MSEHVRSLAEIRTHYEPRINPPPGVETACSGKPKAEAASKGPAERPSAEQLAADYRELGTLGRVAARHGRSPTVVERWFKAAGIKPRWQPLNRFPGIAVIRQAYRERSSQDVTAFFGVTKTTMHRWARQAGVWFERRGQAVVVHVPEGDE
jgi:transposase-like protein